MKLKSRIGQVFLTHPKDKNFTSIFEDSFTKQGSTVELFTVVDIENISSEGAKEARKEYEKVASNLITMLKKVYIASPQADQETFEKALASINTSLSRLASRGEVKWFGRLNAAIAVRYRNTLSLSVTGNAKVYLQRKKDLNLLSEELPPTNSRSVKIFSNYSSGGLASRDRVIVSTHQLFNYLSLERISEAISEPMLDEACREIIDLVKDVRDAGFAAFVIEFYYNGNGEKTPPDTAVPDIQYSSADRPATSSRILSLGRSLLGFAWSAVSNLTKFVYNFFKNRPKKYLFIVIAAVLLLFVVNTVLALQRRSQKELVGKETQTLAEINHKLDEAEAALIYKDEAKAQNFFQDAQSMLADKVDPSLNTEFEKTKNRITVLSAKIKKQIIIENPAQLTEFPNIPTDIIASPNGFLGYNKSTGSVAFYDFRTGETKRLLSDANTGIFLDGDYLMENKFAFLTQNQRFAILDAEKNTLTENASSTAVLNLNGTKVVAIKSLLQGTVNRLYALDSAKNQIYRFRVSGSQVSAAEQWLKVTADLAAARDLSVDDNIYVLYPDHVDKYFNGRKQNFTLGSVLQPLQNAIKIFTKSGVPNIYIADPSNKRIAIFDKNGTFIKEVISDSFAELSDLHIDDKTGVIYVLSGGKLLRIQAE